MKTESATQNLKSNLSKALFALGIPSKSKVTAKVINDRIKVNIDGEYFGLWDIRKRTFTD